MANFPIANFSIPSTWSIDNSTAILCNGSRLAIHADGSIVLEGNVKDAALGLIKYVVDREWVPGLLEIQINKTISIECEGDFKLCYIGKQKPEFWDELVREFNRAAKMKAFW